MGFRPWNVAIAVVALLAMLSVALIAASPEHSHLQATCSFCLAGNLPAENPPASIVAIHGPDVEELLTSTGAILHPIERSHRLPGSRAPPV
jgi:hypothetical protein